MHTMCIRQIDNERYRSTMIRQRSFKVLHNFATITLR